MTDHAERLAWQILTMIQEPVYHSPEGFDVGIELAVEHWTRWRRDRGPVTAEERERAREALAHLVTALRGGVYAR